MHFGMLELVGALIKRPRADNIRPYSQMIRRLTQEKDLFIFSGRPFLLSHDKGNPSDFH